MQVLSQCPMPVGSLLWQSRPSMWVFTVVTRATFVLSPGESTLAPDQEPLREADEHWGDDPSRSLRCASDLAPLKPRADVTLTGHAYAKGGAPARSVVARLVVGEVEKAIEVFCDRWLDPNGTLREGARFTRIPMLYERAASGAEGSNPVGVVAKTDAYGRVVLPNLQPLGLHVASASDYIAPVGMGPVAPTWPGRREKLGRNALTTSADGVFGPLPVDLDPSFFNSAPRDQQVAQLREDERIVLENLHASHARLVTNLPGLRPRASVERKGLVQDVFLRCDTLWIDTDRGLCTLTWRGQVALEEPHEAGRVVVTLDAPAQPSATSSRLSMPVMLEESVTEDEGRMTVAPGEVGTATLIAGLSDSRDLPFAQQLQKLREESKLVAASGGLPFGGAAPPPRSSSPGQAPQFQAPPLAPSVATPLASPPPSAPQFSAPVPPAFNAPALAPAVAPAFNAPALMPPGGSTFGAGALASSALSSSGSWSASEQRPPAPVPPPQADNLLSSSGSWSTGELRPPAPMTVGQLGGSLGPLPTSATPDSPAPAAPIATPVEAPRFTSKLEPGRALQLIWFDPDCAPRVRRKPEFEPIFDEMEERRSGPEHEEPLIARDPMTIEDKRDVFEVLARGDAGDEASLTEALNRGVQSDGRFVSPLLLLAGELRFPFDELETLRATLTIVLPFVGADELLKSAVADARDFLQTPHLTSPPGVTEGFTNRVLDAFRKVRRAVAPTYVEDQTERVLLEKRQYQRKDLFGEPHVRALLAVGTPQLGTTAPRPWPTYLPAAAARKLPMFARFSARLLCDGCLQEDQFETHWGALRVIALARVASLPNRTERSGKG